MNVGRGLNLQAEGLWQGWYCGCYSWNVSIVAENLLLFESYNTNSDRGCLDAAWNCSCFDSGRLALQNPLLLRKKHGGWDWKSSDAGRHLEI